MSIYPITDFLANASVLQGGALSAATSDPANPTAALSSSNNLTLVANAARPSSKASATNSDSDPTKATDPTVKKVVDTVKLSEVSRIQLLTQQGQSPSQIANALGLPLATIDLDLYIAAVPSTLTLPTTSGNTALSTAA